MNRQNSFAIQIAIIVSFGGFIFGLDAALISGTLKSLIQQFSLSDLEVGTVVSAPGFGVIFALLVTGYVCDALGRKNALLIIAFLYLGSCMAATFAPSFHTLVAARFIGGLAFSSLSVAAMYIGEVAPPHARGKLVAVNQLNIVVGLLAAYFVNYLLVKLSAMDLPIVHSLGIQTHLWRWMLGMQIVPSFIWFLLLFLVPESPRWLLLRGRTEEAKVVIKKTLSEADQEEFWREFHEISSVDERSISLRAQLKAFFDKHLRLALIVGFTVAILQPITGINAILFYAPNVFEQVGIGSDQAFLQSAVMGLISVAFTALALVLIDRIGRRTLLLVGLIWAVVSLGMCAWSFGEAKYVLTDQNVATLSQKFDSTGLQKIVGHTYTSDVAFKRAVADNVGSQVAREHE
ncbi:MAG: MFS transporter, partial [Asticcacaulis sp.]